MGRGEEMTASSELAAFADLDEFRLLRTLGRGGMGLVYLAHDTVLDRLVAIKVVGTTSPDAASRERFLTEARAIARLSHPNVVTIYRVGAASDGRPYLVQELIRGISLDKLDTPPTVERVVEIALGVARGVAAAHRLAILHRDIKPANVMIDSSNRVRLLDFGLAKIGALQIEWPASVSTRTASEAVTTTADPSTPPANVHDVAVERPVDGLLAHAGWDTQGERLAGTPRYMAPELWTGGPASVRSDLYSVGAMVYELLAGDAPHLDTDLDRLRIAVTTTDIPTIAAAVPHLDPQLVAIVDRCIARDPASRFESADELAHAIERFLAEAPPVPDGNPYRGLHAFDAQHRSVFFGRGLDVSTIVDRLRTEHLVVIAGDSGIGKSSLCRAGVIPAVEGRQLADGRTWRTHYVVPGRQPFATLCDALGVGAELRQLPATAIAREIVPLADRGVLVVIDQLEELITISDPDDVARASELIATLADGISGVSLVLAVRGDFLTRVASLGRLSPLLARGLHLLRPLAPGDLREAIVGPARVKGVRFEAESTVDELVAFVRDNPGSLPLLQFALAELWAERDPERGVIPKHALSSIGGVASALARHADGVLLGLGADRAAARRVLVRLVTLEGTRAVRERHDLDDGERTTAALEGLVRGRLVVARDAIDGTPGYELAHEALIQRWSTLRGWLDDVAGHRAMHERLAIAAESWRDKPSADLLWRRRQLRTIAELYDLSVAERAFVVASRRRVRLVSWLRVAAVISVPLFVLATWGVVHVRAAQQRDTEIETRQQEAARRKLAADAASLAASQARQLAYDRFDHGDASAGELAWSRARELSRDAHAGFRDAEAVMEAALAIDPDSPELRHTMAQLLFADAELAETVHDGEAVADALQRLDTYDHTLAARWNDPAVLVVSAPGAIAIHGFVDRGGHLVPGPAAAAGSGRVTARLAPGSYTVDVTRADGVVAHAPIVLARGESRELSVPLPTAIPAELVYVPPGDFLIGSDHEDLFRREFLSAAPLHRLRTDGYLIARHEVTFADWIEYLGALSPSERRARTPAVRGDTVKLELGADGRYELTLKPTSDVAYRVREGELLHYRTRRVRTDVRWERLPVTGISFVDARAYAAWLASTGRIPRARLCSEREWEHAARGADGRPFPHGTTVEVDDANLDATYGREPGGYGPDEVGSHPASRSPYGVDDMLGNVWEWVVADGGGPMLRGGCWYYGTSTGLTMNRDPGDAAMREVFTGLRICSDVETAR
jgi:serine/threonine protein kinase/formylglycine-generating enzyme required for sulfatase activity